MDEQKKPKNIGYFIDDTEKSQFLNFVVVYIGFKMFHSNINYCSLEPNFLPFSYQMIS